MKIEIHTEEGKVHGDYGLTRCTYWLPRNHPSELVLWGYDQGQTNIQNSNYHMNGNVEEAFGDFSMWEGRNVYMSGVIEWYGPGEPHYASGTFRIN